MPLNDPFKPRKRSEGLSPHKSASRPSATPVERPKRVVIEIEGHLAVKVWKFGPKFLRERLAIEFGGNGGDIKTIHMSQVTHEDENGNSSRVVMHPENFLADLDEPNMATIQRTKHETHREW